MTKRRPSQQIMHESFDGRLIQLSSIAPRVHVFFQVLVHILKDEHEFVFGVNNIVQRDYVLVFEFLHQTDFSNCGGRGALF